MPNIQSLREHFAKDAQDAPIVALRAALEDLIADDRHCEVFLNLVAVFETAQDVHTEQENHGIAGDYAHFASVIRDYFLS